MTIATQSPPTLTLDDLATYFSWNVTVEELAEEQIYREVEFNLDEAVFITDLARDGAHIVITGVDPIDGTPVETTLRDDLPVVLLTPAAPAGGRV